MRLYPILAGAGALAATALLALEMSLPANQVPLPRPRPLERLAVATAAPLTADVIQPRPVETVRVTPPKAAAVVVGMPSVPPLVSPPAQALAPPAAAIEKLPEEMAAEPKVRRKREASSDVCERHGLRKVVTNGGRSWRCRR